MSNGEMTLYICDDLKVEVEYEIIGENIPATLIDPAEHKEINIIYVVVNGCDISACLTDQTFKEITADIVDKLGEEIGDFYENN